MKNFPWKIGYVPLFCCLLGLTGCKSTPPPVPVQDMQPQPVVQNPALPLEKIVEMSRSGMSPEIIKNQIRNTGSTYMLSVDQIQWLKQQGVSDDVIAFMQTQGGAPPSPQAYVRPAVVGPAVVAPPVYVAPYPGYGYGYWGRRGYYY